MTTTAASEVTTTSAILNGTVNAYLDSTTVIFQYGTTKAYGSTIAATPGTVTGMTNTHVSAAISGLNPKRVYHFRVVGVNSAGTTNGSDLTFTKSGTPLRPLPHLPLLLLGE